LFYLLVGPAYRLSLLGVFSVPLVMVMQLAAIGFILTGPAPAWIGEKGPFHAIHSATAALAYGALGLAAISGVMFLTLNHQLKEQVLRSGLFRNMPPAHLLLVSLERLLWVGAGLLTIGVAAGFLMPRQQAINPHLALAIGVWLAYLALLAFKTIRGMTGRKLALAAVTVFLAALLVFASV
jgi:ABC-type uncharacterized transport system permease subunit